MDVTANLHNAAWAVLWAIQEKFQSSVICLGHTCDGIQRFRRVTLPHFLPYSLYIELRFDDFDQSDDNHDEVWVAGIMRSAPDFPTHNHPGDLVLSGAEYNCWRLDWTSPPDAVSRWIDSIWNGLPVRL
jgi:hypothetical protein